MSTYPSIGNVARLSCTFTDPDGNAADPSTTTVQVKAPGQALTTQTPTRDATGAYHYDVELTTPGQWGYRFIATGDVVARSADMTIYVPEPSF